MNPENDPIRWLGGVEGKALIIDQTKLPRIRKEIAINTAEQMWDAIYKLQIRGAPAIGIAAAYGLFLGIRGYRDGSFAKFVEKLDTVAAYLNRSRPTAVNLPWALKRMGKAARNLSKRKIEEIKLALLQEAHKILKEDVDMCHKIGSNGATLVKNGSNILTHCNAGGLATSGYGTALGVIFSAFEQGKQLHVFVDETRPLWQGARLTTWELMQAKIPTTLICDNTAAFLMQQNKIDMVVVGADRIAANGDTANKIGTYGVAVAAAVHDIPFYVAAPSSTFDLDLENGKNIPIEERAAKEITDPTGYAIAPEGIDVYSPAFDVTPAHYIAGIITERTVLRPPYTEAISQLNK